MTSPPARQPRRTVSSPVHRSILAVDIEGSTRRNNQVKEELRAEMYRLVYDALCTAGIGDQHHDPIVDRGDGMLVLLRPMDDIPKPLLLNRLIPTLARLLAARNSEISPADKPRILRLRAVIHAGDVHRDGNGPFGEDLDVAFRLLDAPRFKAELKSATVPLALVASDYIYQSVIKRGYEGIDNQEYRPLVTVNVGNQRRKGWVHLPVPEPTATRRTHTDSTHIPLPGGALYAVYQMLERRIAETEEPYDVETGLAKLWEKMSIERTKP